MKRGGCSNNFNLLCSGRDKDHFNVRENVKEFVIEYVKFEIKYFMDLGQSESIE